MSSSTRTETDSFGPIEVPADAYWGVHTLRAVDNFPITGVPVGHFPDLVRALALVKQAAALIGGSGGGKPDYAQAGGKDAAKLPEALKKAEQLGREKLSS